MFNLLMATVFYIRVCSPCCYITRGIQLKIKPMHTASLMSIHVLIYIYIYMYICVCVCVCVYIYIYIYIYIIRNLSHFSLAVVNDCLQSSHMLGS